MPDKTYDESVCFLLVRKSGKFSFGTRTASTRHHVCAPLGISARVHTGVEYCLFVSGSYRNLLTDKQGLHTFFIEDIQIQESFWNEISKRMQNYVSPFCESCSWDDYPQICVTSPDPGQVEEVAYEDWVVNDN